DREGGGTARPQRRVRTLGGELDVLRVVVAAPQDDQILDAAGDEQLAPGEEAEVAGAQETPPFQGGAEGALRLLVPVPVAGGDARTGHPDLTDPVRRAGPACLGIDDRQLAGSLSGSLAAPDETTTGRGHGAPLGEGSRVERAHHRRIVLAAAGDEQGGLGESVARVEGLRTETAGGKRRAEALHDLGAHRLGAVERHRPARQVEPGPLRRADLAYTKVVGEARAAARRTAVAADRLQPAQRLLQERQGRHEDTAR